MPSSDNVNNMVAGGCCRPSKTDVFGSGWTSYIPETLPYIPTTIDAVKVTYKVIGTCSICYGPVQIPIFNRYPPVKPACRDCGAVRKEATYGPVIDMVPIPEYTITTTAKPDEPVHYMMPNTASVGGAISIPTVWIAPQN